MSREAAKYRSVRRYFWLRPVVLLPAASMLVLSLPMLWWIDTYNSLAADIMFMTTYLSLIGWLVFMSKGTLLEPHIKVNTKAIKKEEADLQQHRREKRQAMYATELRMLEKGEVTPVLDVWQLDLSLRSRHPLIPALNVCRIDPIAREFELSLVLDETWEFSGDKAQSQKLLRTIGSFLRFVAKDQDVMLFRPFAETLFVMVHRLVDDGSLHGKSMCIASLRVDVEELDRYAQTSASGELPGDVRFTNGDEVEPHRAI